MIRPATTTGAEALSRAIVEEARAQAEKILQQARDQAADLLASAHAQVQAIRSESRNRAASDSARHRELTLARIPVESARRRCKHAEALLDAVRDEAARRLAAHEGFDYPAVVAALVAEAVHAMDADRFLVKLSPSDARDLAPLLQSLPIELLPDPAIDHGAIVQDADARLLWDNRLLPRLHRLWPDLRPQIAARAGLLFTERPAPAPASSSSSPASASSAAGGPP